MFYLMKSKYAVFSNIKVTKIERSALLGTPGIWKKTRKTRYLLSLSDSDEGLICEISVLCNKCSYAIIYDPIFLFF